MDDVSEQVREAVARELRALTEIGVIGPGAECRALAIVAAKVRNSPAFVESQAHPGHCHACGEPLDDARPVVAAMQAKGGGHLWMHGGECHDAHRRRRAEMVDGILRDAGFGPDQRTGEAA